MQLNLPFARSTLLDAPSTLHVARSTLHDEIQLVRHPRARHYVIRVGADGAIRVTVPRGGSKREARAFVEQKRQWIDRQRQRAALEKAEPRETIPPEVERHLRERAGRELPERLLELADEHKLHVSRVSVRNQRWRWGSCSPTGHICLNWRLVQVPTSIRDYVLIHELMHLRRMDHSPKFWNLVGRACPDYEGARRWLSEHARRP